MFQKNPDSLTEAALVLIERDGRYLGVSRKNDPHAFNLPGGKVDRSETAEEGARRELYEETGLLAGDLTPFFQSAESGKYLVTVFYTTEIEQDPNARLGAS